MHKIKDIFLILFDSILDIFKTLFVHKCAIVSFEV